MVSSLLAGTKSLQMPFQAFPPKWGHINHMCYRANFYLHHLYVMFQFFSLPEVEYYAVGVGSSGDDGACAVQPH